MSTIDIIRGELETAATVLDTFRKDPEILQKIDEAALIFSEALRSGNKALSCGNGGSMCDAMHFAEELTGRYRENRRALAAIAIADQSHMTCVGNDFGFDAVFSRYIEALGREGDVLLAISTSGNSPNILQAVSSAQARGMKVVALTGKGGGKLAAQADVVIDVPYQGYADRIQEIHIKVIHILIMLIEQQVTA